MDDAGATPAEGPRDPGRAGDPRRPPARRSEAAPDRSRRPPAGTTHELAELVSRVVERGVVVTGDVTISVAGVDLIHLGLDLLLAAADRRPGPPRDRGGERPPSAGGRGGGAPGTGPGRGDPRA